MPKQIFIIVVYNNKLLIRDSDFVWKNYSLTRNRKALRRIQ